MRRLLSILLLAVFALPLVSPLFVLGGEAESRLPACCRRNGAHHCAMSMGMAGESEQGTHVSAPPMRCPAFPQAVSPAQHHDATIHAAALLFADVQSHPSVKMQTEAWARVALDGARYKRGPPAVRLS